MNLDAATLLRALTGLALASALASGCTHSVVFGSDDEGDDGCGDPPPEESSWCPPAWTCIEGEWVDTAGPCPNPCPAEQPASGSACAAQGVICSYEGFEDWGCGDGEWTTVKVQCTEEGWTQLSTHCQPEPVCPEEAPIDGTDCSGWYHAYFCDYPIETSCGDTWLDARCDFSTPTPTWSVQTVNECATSCSEHADAAACEAGTTCRWLEPGCSEESLAQAGCFPVEPCGPDSCSAGESCQTVSVDPCWNSSCDACASETSVCLPPA